MAKSVLAAASDLASRKRRSDELTILGLSHSEVVPKASKLTMNRIAEQRLLARFHKKSADKAANATALQLRKKIGGNRQKPAIKKVTGQVFNGFANKREPAKEAYDLRASSSRAPLLNLKCKHATSILKIGPALSPTSLIVMDTSGPDLLNSLRARNPKPDLVKACLALIAYGGQVVTETALSKPFAFKRGILVPQSIKLSSSFVEKHHGFSKMLRQCESSQDSRWKVTSSEGEKGTRKIEDVAQLCSFLQFAARVSGFRNAVGSAYLQ